MNLCTLHLDVEGHARHAGGQKKRELGTSHAMDCKAEDLITVAYGSA